MATYPNAQMWPPDRNFRRDPNAKSEEALTIFEKVIRYAEKDDFLLYATAIFGIVMPGIMYFVYKAVHAKYQVYAKRKREEVKKEKARKRAITFLYLPTANNLKRLAFSLAEQLEGHEPLVIPLIPANLNIFYDYKGTIAFIVPDNETSSMSEADNWFFDWLQEMRFVAKERSLLCTLAYAIFSVTEAEKGNEIGKMASNLSKRLNALEAREIQPHSFIWTNKETDVETQIENYGAILSESMRSLWKDYDSDETDLMSAEDTMSESDFDEAEKKTK